MALNTFSPNQVIPSAEINDNFTDLSTGAEDTDTNSLALWRGDTKTDFVADGCVWSIDSGLVGAMTAGNVYITVSGSMSRVSVAQILSKSFSVSKDTYVDVDNGGTVRYTEVANAAASPSVYANGIRLAKVVTDGSSITSIKQIESDDNGVEYSAVADGVYRSWDPTFTSLTEGNGTLLCSYTRIGKTVRGQIHFTLGTTSTVGDVIFDLPIPSKTGTLNFICGQAFFNDASGNDYFGYGILRHNNSDIQIRTPIATGTYVQDSSLSSTAPFTWASTDQLSITFEYEID